VNVSFIMMMSDNITVSSVMNIIDVDVSAECILQGTVFRGRTQILSTLPSPSSL